MTCFELFENVVGQLSMFCTVCKLLCHVLDDSVRAFGCFVSLGCSWVLTFIYVVLGCLICFQLFLC